MHALGAEFDSEGAMASAHLAIAVNEQDHTIGPDAAPVTLVEYGDFECPHCGRGYPLIEGIRRYMGDKLRFVFRHFPLAEAHPHAQHAAEASEAAAAQGKFWEMHKMLFEHQDALEDEDLLTYAAQIGCDVRRASNELADGIYTKKVRGDFRGGVRSGVNGTPTFFINGTRFDGDWTDSNEFILALTEAASVAHAGAH
jgi:protein-disulfide isomerase